MWLALIAPLWILCASIAMYIIERGYMRRYPALWADAKTRWWFKSILLGPIGLLAAWSVYGKRGDH